jgi:hypothetical protein
MAKVGQVHADLVGAPRPEFRLDQADTGERLERSDHRVGGATARPGRECRSAGARPGAADSAGHQHLAHETPTHERNVAALHGVAPELALQVFGSRVGKREDEDARGVAVEPVHHQHPPVAAGAALEFGCSARQYRVLLALGRRVDQEAGRLVDHEHIVVEVHDLDGRSLGHASTLREVGVVLDGVALPDDRARVGDHGAVDEHMTQEHLALGVRVGGGQQLLRRASEPSRSSFHAARVTPRGRRTAKWTPASFSG